MNRAESHNTKENINNLFSNPAYVRRYLNPSRLRFYEEVVEVISEKIEFRGKKIADMGCATGHLLQVIDRNYEVDLLVGIDFSASALTIAKNLEWNNDIQFHEYDLRNPLNEFDECFDVVICTQTLEHLKEPREALENMLNTLAFNGTMVITIPDGDIDKFVGSQHINAWNEGQFSVFISEVVGKIMDSWRYNSGRLNVYPYLWSIIWKDDA